MAIAKRHVDVEELLGTFLDFTPQAADTDLFRADMRLLNPVLLKDAIKECHATTNTDQQRGMAKRAEIHRVYTRKTKELASLYPFIFSVENALRHAAAIHYSDVFSDDSWWKVIRDKCDKGQNENAFLQNRAGNKMICGVKVTPKFVAQLCKNYSSFTDHQKRSLQDANAMDEFYLHLTLGSLFSLILADWTCARGMFVSDESLGGTFRKRDLENWFTIIRKARNELFHSKSIGDIAKVARACENTLDKLGIHLNDFDSNIAAAQITRPPLTIERYEYHLLPPK